MIMECELCGRKILWGDDSKHHLVPRQKGGTHGPTVVFHNVCHKQIHALFSEHELALFYNTLPKLKAHRDVQRFVKWVNKKPNGFNSRVRIRRKRR